MNRQCPIKNIKLRLWFTETVKKGWWESSVTISVVSDEYATDDLKPVFQKVMCICTAAKRIH